LSDAGGQGNIEIKSKRKRKKKKRKPTSSYRNTFPLSMNPQKLWFPNWRLVKFTSEAIHRGKDRVSQKWVYEHVRSSGYEKNFPRLETLPQKIYNEERNNKGMVKILRNWRGNHLQILRYTNTLEDI